MHYINSNRKHKDFLARPELFPQKRFNPKPCRKCETIFEPQAPSHLYCSQSCADHASSEKLLQRNYKIGVEEVERMRKDQKDSCGICGESGFLMRKDHKKPLVVDHCHTTGRVRGLLCHNCNRALGLFKDNKERLLRAVEYLSG